MESTALSASPAPLAPGIAHALNISGYMVPVELTYLAEVASRSHRIAEIGSFQGRSTRALADNTPGVVYAVDTWNGSDEEWHRALLKGKPPNWLLEEFLRNMKGLSNVTICRQTSLEAARRFSDSKTAFDLVFIDASHDYASVSADIKAWEPLLQPGGIFCGHDFNYRAFPGVARAVNELVPRFRVVKGTSLWTTDGAA